MIVTFKELELLLPDDAHVVVGVDDGVGLVVAGFVAAPDGPPAGVGVPPWGQDHFQVAALLLHDGQVVFLVLHGELGEDQRHSGVLEHLADGWHPRRVELEPAVKGHHQVYQKKINCNQ